MNNDIFTKLSRLAKIMSIIGVCTLGINPAFGVMGITVGLVFKYKGAELDDENKKRLRTAFILGIISLAMFVIDIIIAVQYV
ncbi:MAG: hypothetical protein K2G65_04620, partial [Eubacterium sp.]|nr:hypothetical protein [Eubacterium sp.]